jgi:peptide/nickel transport system permease protein
MINSARMELSREPVVWWPLVCAFLFMFPIVLAANLFADVVRDAFDPRISGSADRGQKSRLSPRGTESEKTLSS